MHAQIAVIGAGVNGLSTAIRLLEKGFAVTLFARDLTSDMASRGAPAIWLPYKASPEHLVLAWASRALAVYQTLDASAGVELVPYTEFNDTTDLPLWTQIITDYQDIPSEQLSPAYARGLHTQLYRIDTSVYLNYLMSVFQKLKGRIQQKELQNITEIDPEFSLIINCSGVWSHTLVPDTESFPIRGQYLLLDKPAGVDTIKFAAVDAENYTLVVPRTQDCYIGGTTINHQWSTEVNPDTSEQILQRAVQLEPLLKNARVKHVGVCLRPGRKSIRLEAEQLSDQRTVIHNYGHGGSGFTVSWGCADAVLDLVLGMTGVPSL